ncbi:MAG TPA: DUF1840 domain-containing protein [Povalibacter sp.]|uniref:DUF1840 domain-containing protein n=1 Tax=Povalibacter sp. TaxID=1962978 RepID=UPI002B6B3EAB|nr:DUF1840 domain-containing protein [Povalibacter sp.]HMN44335.1 DUF1840 domain-containing protein [Povalibacter sp.]
MLIIFRSTATGSITMFGDTAKQLLSLMGTTGRIPAALTGEDVGVALTKLEAGLAELKRRADAEHHTAAPPAMNEDLDAEEEERHEPPIELAVRAAPLIDLLRRASAAKAEVTWEAKG